MTTDITDLDQAAVQRLINYYEADRKIHEAFEAAIFERVNGLENRVIKLELETA